MGVARIGLRRPSPEAPERARRNSQAGNQSRAEVYEPAAEPASRTRRFRAASGQRFDWHLRTVAGDAKSRIFRRDFAEFQHGMRLLVIHGSENDQ
jgi:hypothetical protein